MVRSEGSGGGISYEDQRIDNTPAGGGKSANELYFVRTYVIHLVVINKRKQLSCSAVGCHLIILA